MLRLVITAICTTALLPAQTFTGTILGAVEDSSGAAIPGARVVARETSTNVQRIATANGLGYYEIPLLPPGLYQLEASHTGFKTSSRANLKLDTDQKMEIRIVMSPGDVKETVEVRAETPLLQTTGSSVGQVVDNKNVVDLPLSNRNLLQLVNLVAGVNDFGAGAAPATTRSVA